MTGGEGLSASFGKESLPACKRARLGRRLDELVREVPGASLISGEPSLLLQGVHHDSRRVSPGDVFVARAGQRTHGDKFVADALARGASAVIVERASSVSTNGAARIEVDDPAHALAFASAAVYGHPTFSLEVVGVTGTNGKTTTAHLVQACIDASGGRAGIVGTLGYRFEALDLPSTHTSPEADDLARIAASMSTAGATHLVMEASSIALAARRVEAVRFRVAAFTNLTQDHLDYHGTMEAYWQAKRALFVWPGLKAVVVNVDDPRGAELAAELQPHADSGEIDLWTVSAAGRAARLHVPDWTLTDTGLRFHVVEQLPEGRTSAVHQIKLPLVGEYNLYNLLCALATARAQGYTLAEAVQASRALTPVPGRMQSAWATEDDALPLVLVDYAHTPDALEKALQALQPLAMQRGGRLWCVVGCGGDRDATKRPLMAAVAEREAAQLVLTSDNPRTEDPMHILQQMVAGLSQPAAVQVQPDRGRAIAHVVAQAGVRDVVLLAGKGHEDYQEIAGVKRPFSDLDEARQALQRRRASPTEVQP